MICPHGTCGKYTGSDAGSKPCADHQEQAQRQPPTPRLPPVELTEFYARHRLEVDNGLWPARDCPICRWIIAKPDIAERWLKAPQQHWDSAA